MFLKYISYLNFAEALRKFKYPLQTSFNDFSSEQNQNSDSIAHSGCPVPIYTKNEQMIFLGKK